MDDRNYNDNADNAYWSEKFSKAGAQVAMKVLPQGVLPSSCGLKPETTTEQNAVDGEAVDKKRAAPIPVRASEQQKILIKAKATAAGVAVSCYMLIAALGCDYKPPRDPELVQVSLKLNRELKLLMRCRQRSMHSVRIGKPKRIFSSSGPIPHPFALQTLTACVKPSALTLKLSQKAK